MTQLQILKTATEEKDQLTSCVYRKLSKLYCICSVRGSAREASSLSAAQAGLASPHVNVPSVSL